ncbi:uncharacterized protein LOC128596571 [Nycticebus coucang]|uniref:uncharacterized protein LOC128596571 n=1 Tax=Nycticebus coucang TaxID=9470 RepID=UPI00234E025B|nr:uncharacterized protein LOC128596571 [Nycticebus coucang]
MDPQPRPRAGVTARSSWPRGSGGGWPEAPSREPPVAPLGPGLIEPARDKQTGRLGRSGRGAEAAGPEGPGSRMPRSPSPGLSLALWSHPEVPPRRCLTRCPPVARAVGRGSAGASEPTPRPRPAAFVWGLAGPSSSAPTAPARLSQGRSPSSTPLRGVSTSLPLGRLRAGARPSSCLSPHSQETGTPEPVSVAICACACVLRVSECTWKTGTSGVRQVVPPLCQCVQLRVPSPTYILQMGRSLGHTHPGSPV